MATSEVKIDEQRIDPATGEYRVITPGQTFRGVTEKITRLVLTPHTPASVLDNVANVARHASANMMRVARNEPIPAADLVVPPPAQPGGTARREPQVEAAS